MRKASERAMSGQLCVHKLQVSIPTSSPRSKHFALTPDHVTICERPELGRTRERRIGMLELVVLAASIGPCCQKRGWNLQIKEVGWSYEGYASCPTSFS